MRNWQQVVGGLLGLAGAALLRFGPRRGGARLAALALFWLAAAGLAWALLPPQAFPWLEAALALNLGGFYAAILYSAPTPTRHSNTAATG